MSRIEIIRKKIDRLDEKILALLVKRAGYSEAIGKLKKKKVDIHQPDREKKALIARKRIVRGTKLSGAFIEALFKAIFRESKRIQSATRASLTKKTKNAKL